MIEATTPLISVIVTTYNRKSLLIETLKSIKAQTWPNIETIVVDDGSNQKTFSSEEAENLGIRYFYRQNSGQSASRNFGVQSAQGEYISFIDDDDLWHPQKLEIQMRGIQQGYQWAYCDCIYFHHDTGIHFDRHSRIHSPSSGDVRIPILRGCFIASPTVLVKRTLLDECGGFFENRLAKLGEDWFMWIRIAHKAKVIYINEALAYYRVHGNSMLGNSNLSVIVDSHRIGLDLVFSALSTLPTHRKICWKSNWQRFARMAYSKGESRQARAYLLKSIRLGSVWASDVIIFLLTFIPHKAFLFYRKFRAQ